LAKALEQQSHQSDPHDPLSEQRRGPLADAEAFARDDHRYQRLLCEAKLRVEAIFEDIDYNQATACTATGRADEPPATESTTTKTASPAISVGR